MCRAFSKIAGEMIHDRDGQKEKNDVLPVPLFHFSFLTFELGANSPFALPNDLPRAFGPGKLPTHVRYGIYHGADELRNMPLKLA